MTHAAFQSTIFRLTGNISLVREDHKIILPSEFEINRPMIQGFSKQLHDDVLLTQIINFIPRHSQDFSEYK